MRDRNLADFGLIGDLLKTWDRAAFEVLCRRLEILLLRGKLVAARRAIEAFNGHIELNPVTDDTPVHEAFATRTANLLESSGYLTVGSVCRSPDHVLMQITEFGPSTLHMVNAVRTALRNRSPLHRVIDESFPDLKPEFTLR